MAILKIKKRDESIADFDASRIITAIHRAISASGGKDGKLAEKLGMEAARLLEKRFPRAIPSVEDAQIAVETVLRKKGYKRIAEEYSSYREKKREIRQIKKSLGIKPETKMSVNSLIVLKKRYLLKDEAGKIKETPQEMFRRVARAIASADSKYGGDPATPEEEFFSMMSKLEFLPNSPTLYNAGAPLGQLSACFVLPVEDSLSSIFKAVTDTAMIHQSGGGTGYSFSKLRPKGDIVRSTGGEASGPVSFMKIFDAATQEIKQGGKRRGANMGILRVDHPDILEFISAKQDPKVLSNFNISVAITDRFMDAVRTNSEYELISPRSGEVVKRMNARKVWGMIIEMAWKTGDPGVIFIDRINQLNPTSNIGLIESTNPCGEQPLHPFESCFAPETRITTKDGLETIEELYKKQEMQKKPIIIATNLNGEQNQIIFRSATVTKIGRKSTLKLTLTNGQSLRLTPDHKVYTRDGWKEAGKLTESDDVMIQTAEAGDFIFDLPREEVEVYQMFGWFTGDGWFTKTAGLTFGPQDTVAFDNLVPVWNEFTQSKTKVNVQRNFVRCISSEKKSVLEKFASYGFKQARGPDKSIPTFIFTASKQAQIAYLQGLFSADGTKPIDPRRSRHKVELSSRSLDILRGVQLLLLNMGIKSRIHFSVVRKTGKPQGLLRVSGEDFLRFRDLIGFSLAPYKQERALNDSIRRLAASKVWIRVKRVEESGEETVYDITEPITNSLIAEGMIVHNCNLGSINLAKMLKEENGKYEIDWDKLKATVRKAVHFLDNVIDSNKYPIPEIAEITRANRRIGLGVMGFADMLIALDIPYDSEEAMKAAENVMRFIEEEGHKKSIEIGEKRGSFPNFKGSLWEKKGYRSMRNATVTTIAPTGSISIIAGCSSGIEPLFAITYIRNVLEGTRLLEVNPIFEKIAKERGFYKPGVLEQIAKTGTIQKVASIPKDVKRIFKTALEINPEWHVKMQAAFQKYTDNAVSKTINFPENAKKGGVKKSYELAYRLGCKGITIYRYGSKPEQVLYMSLDKKLVAEADYSGGCPTPICPTSN